MLLTTNGDGADDPLSMMKDKSGYAVVKSSNYGEIKVCRTLGAQLFDFQQWNLPIVLDVRRAEHLR